MTNRSAVTALAALAMLNVFTLGAGVAVAGLLPDRLALWQVPRVAYLQDIEDVPAYDRLEIRHFFEVYKALEPGKSTGDFSWADRAAAEEEIEACRLRATSHE